MISLQQIIGFDLYPEMGVLVMTNNDKCCGKKNKSKCCSAGKGDRFRKINQEKWDDGWEKAFGKKRKGKKNE